MRDDACMPLTTGFNHVATLTTDMARTVGVYEEAFGAVVIGELAKREGHPWMKTLDLGGGSALNVFEVPAEEIIGGADTVRAVPSTTSETSMAATRARSRRTRPAPCRPMLSCCAPARTGSTARRPSP